MIQTLLEYQRMSQSYKSTDIRKIGDLTQDLLSAYTRSDMSGGEAFSM